MRRGAQPTRTTLETDARRRRYPAPHAGDRPAVDGDPLERRTGIRRLLAVCGWVAAGSMALLAIWELGHFSVLVGNGPLLPSAVREAPPAAKYRPAGKDESGCTQAAINRKSGHTMPADCHHTFVPRLIERQFGAV